MSCGLVICEGSNMGTLRRVLVEVVEIRDDSFVVVIPKWKLHEQVILSSEILPLFVKGSLFESCLLLALVNVDDAVTQDDLVFEDFKIV